MEELELLNKLFEVVRNFVLGSGGDGDGFIISEQYQKLANSFEAYEKQHGNWFITRSEFEGCIVFGNNQEAVFFMKDRTTLPNWKGDIIIEIF